MNIIDMVILGVIGLSVLWGLYRGCIHSLLNLGGGLTAFAGAFWLFPKLADVVSANTDITRMISTYTDSGKLLGDLDLSNQAVAALSGQNISDIVEKASLPHPLDTLLEHNLTGQVFSPLGSFATNVGDYVNQTILSVSINVVCFLICFAVCFAVMSVIINIMRSVFRFPLLKHLDTLCGGILGLLLGVLLCFAIFTILPLLESVMPIPEFHQMVAGSELAHFFTDGSLIVSIMNRHL